MTDGLRDSHREAIIAEIAANERVERAVLFGSRATGTNTVTSDVDIALFGDRLTLTDQARLATAMDEIPMAQKVDLVLYDSIRDLTLREHVQREGIEWYARPAREEEIAPGCHGRREAWTSVNLGRCCIKIGSGATPRGGKRVYLSRGPYALIRSQNVLNDGFAHAGLAYIGERHAAELGNVEVLDGDVLLNITGDSVARACQVDTRILPARVNQHVAIIRPDPTKLDPGFLRYFLICPETQAKLLSWAGSGGTRNALTKAMIEAFDVLAPEDVWEQRAIARVLGALDAKVELNRRTSETLEAIARALFKSWFVDFEPVQARTEGRNTGLRRDLADLFPDRFVDSEMGEIPEGWTIRRVSDVCKRIENGGTPKRSVREYWNGDIKWFKTSELADKPVLDSAEHITELGLRNSSCKTWPPETVLIALYASPTVGRLGILATSGAANQACCALVAEADVGASFLYYVLRFGRPHFQNVAVGAAQQNISQSIVKDYQFVMPTADVLRAFGGLAKEIYLQRVSRHSESDSLRELCSTLLPKLVSGELRVLDAESLLEAAI